MTTNDLESAINVAFSYFVGELFFKREAGGLDEKIRLHINRDGG